MLCHVDTLGIEPRASRMLSGCDTTTPRALWLSSNDCANFALVCVHVGWLLADWRCFWQAGVACPVLAALLYESFGFVDAQVENLF